MQQAEEKKCQCFCHPNNFFPGAVVFESCKHCHFEPAPAQDHDFIECDTCRAKAGSPELCYGCLKNRDLIKKLKEEKSKSFTEGQEQMKEEALKRTRTPPVFRGRHSPETVAQIKMVLKSVAMERRNKHGTCDLQLMARLRNLAKDLNRTPHAKEVPFLKALIRAFGTYATACEAAGLGVWPRGVPNGEADVTFKPDVEERENYCFRCQQYFRATYESKLCLDCARRREELKKIIFTNARCLKCAAHFNYLGPEADIKCARCGSVELQK